MLDHFCGAGMISLQARAEGMRAGALDKRKSDFHDMLTPAGFGHLD